MTGPIKATRPKGKMGCSAGATLGRWASLWLWIFFLAGPYGCMHPISKDVRMAVDKDQTFSEIIQDPEAYINSTVLWGGVIEKAIHGPDGTELIVRQAPIDSKGYPRTDISEGEFMVHTLRHLNPEIFLRGTKVTIAGEIYGVAERKLGPVGYPCPMVRVIEIHAWTKRWGSFPIARGWQVDQYSPSTRGMVR